MRLERQTQIERLRVRSRGANARATANRVSRLLAATDLTCPGLPPSAVLIVRKLDDPLPGRICEPNGGLRIRRRWQRAAEDSIAGAHRQARRPADGDVPTQAVAVVFADSAELLACLAIDLVRRQIAARWWWSIGLRKQLLGVDASPEHLFQRHIRLLPAVCTYLMRGGNASEVFRTVAPSAAVDLLTSLGNEYDAREICRVAILLKGALDTERPTLEPSPGGESAMGTQGGDRGRQSVFPGALNAGHSPPPWPRSLTTDDIPADLELPQQCLLAVSSLLFVDPLMAQSPSFGGSLARWVACHRDVTTTDAVDPDTLAGGKSEAPTSVPQHLNDVVYDSVAPRSDVDATDSGRLRSLAGRATQHRRQVGSRRRLGDGVSGVDSVHSPDIPSCRRDNRTPAPEAESRSVVEHEDVARAHHAPAADEVQTTAPTTVSASPAEHPIASHGETDIFTQVGGVLYLLHLLRELELPECFSMPWKLAERISSWGLLELLGRALPSVRLRELNHDPLWAALAKLDGRPPGTLPGAQIEPRLPFHLPEFWFSRVAVDEDRYCWAADDRRLYLWSRAGYLLADVDRGSGDAAAQAVLLLERYRPPEPGMLAAADRASVPLADVDELLEGGLDPGLARWLSIVTPCLRRRLRLALDEQEDAAIDDMLCCPGRVFVGVTHVDFVTALERISLPVRLAGLDRNPGWLPAFGRVVLFRFE